LGPESPPLHGKSQGGALGKPLFVAQHTMSQLPETIRSGRIVRTCEEGYLSLIKKNPAGIRIAAVLL
jgi:hypothetical protein